MLSFRSLGFSLPSFASSSSSSTPGLHLASVEIHDIEEKPEKRARTLKHLIRANHINHSIIYHSLQFHNHVPHILGSAYLLGADSDQLTAIYEKEEENLEPWHDSPGEISKHDWRDYLGKRNYQRAWVDFFEDQLVLHGYDWRELVDEFLFQGREPLFNNLISGLGHPLIHLGYAFELASRTVAIEALALAAAFYDKQHTYLDDPSYTKPSPWSSESPFEILQKLHKDSRLDDWFDAPGPANYGPLADDKDKEEIILEYWNSWTICDPKAQFEAAQRTAVALLVGSYRDGAKFDFFLVHLLTSSYAVRVVAPMVPKRWHVSLMRQWWLLAVTAYIGQNRPSFSEDAVADVPLQGRDWSYVYDRAVNGAWAQDPHFVKACRSMKEAAVTWGDDDEYYLKAAIKFVEEFTGWGGFGSMSIEEAEAVVAELGYPGSYNPNTN